MWSVIHSTSIVLCVRLGTGQGDPGINKIGKIPSQIRNGKGIVFSLTGFLL